MVDKLVERTAKPLLRLLHVGRASDQVEEDAAQASMIQRTRREGLGPLGIVLKKVTVHVEVRDASSVDHARGCTYVSPAVRLVS